MSSQQSQQVPSGPPYASPYASLGGRPSNIPDIPILAILLPLYIAAAAANMTILQINLKRGHKFIISGAAFGFCMTRITAVTMRIVWSQYPTNIKIAIATGVFTNAGVIIFFVINVILAQRILRAYHPHLGWSKPVGLAYKFVYFSFFACLVCLITSIVYSMFTLDKAVLTQLRTLRLFASTYLAVLTFIPIPIVLFAVLVPSSSPIDHFGKKGSMSTRVALVLFTSFLLCFGATYRAVAGYTRRPVADPGWWNHKAAFYCVNFLIEIIVVYTYTLSRFDLRFHIPNGSSAPGHYSSGVTDKNGSATDPSTSEVDAEQGQQTPMQERERRWEARVNDELPDQQYEMKD